MTLLLDAAGVDVVCQAATGAELLARMRHVEADAAILDIRMPPTYTDEGIVAAHAFRYDHPTTGVLVLSTYAETAHAVSLLETHAGGVGYLLKDRVSDSKTLLDALERVARGETVLEPDIVRRLMARDRGTQTLAGLTERERLILQLMAEGRSNSGIAEQLHVGVKTVERHIANVFTALGLSESKTDNRRVLAVLSWLRVVDP
jgi:DNA-binding NarL/FixJ family response regulator